MFVLSKKIKLIHLLTQPEQDRERRSIESLRSLIPYGFDYRQHINEPYEGEHPDISPGAYGCYLAHRRALMEEQDEDLLLVCECDCVILPSPQEFMQIVFDLIGTMDTMDLACVSIGGIIGVKAGKPVVVKVFKNVFICDAIAATHCLLYRGNMVKNIVKDKPVHEWDIWLSQNIGPLDKLAVTQPRYTNQINAMSLVNKGEINGTEHYCPFPYGE